MNNELEIENKVKELSNLIKETNDYKNYLKLKEIIKDDKEIQSYQKEILILKKLIANKKDLEENEKRLQEINHSLDMNPIYREYLNYVDNVNNIYYIIENTLNKYFEDKLN